MFFVPAIVFVLYMVLFRVWDAKLRKKQHYAQTFSELFFRLLLFIDLAHSVAVS